MRCPRCETTVLDEIDREGVTVDRCAKCRGIWLDRGELEKILARSGDEMGAYAGGTAPAGFGREQHRRRDHDREPPSSRPSHRGRKRSFWHELFD